MKILFSFFLLSILFFSSAHAVTNSSASIDSLLRSAWDNSPALQAQKDQADLAAGDRYRRFIFNEPQFQVSSLDDKSGLSYGLSIATGFPGKALALSSLDTAKAHAQNAEMQAKKHDLSKIVVQSYTDCAAAKESVRVLTATAGDLETLFKTLKALYENGRSTQAEKIGAELQSRQAHLDLLTAEDRESVLCKKLDKTLRTVGVDQSLEGQVIPLPDDLDSKLLAEIGGETADQARASSGMELADANSKTAWWSQLPDMVFGVSRNNYVYLPASPTGKEWTTSLSVSITVPILFPFHESVEASRAKSQAVLDHNAAEIQKVSADSDRVDGAQEYVRDQRRLKEVREKDLPLAQALVDSTYSAYQSGKLGYAELVLSRKTLSDIQNQDIQLRVSVINAHLRCLNQCEVAAQ
jgi:outer membrane protein TolC